MERCVALYAAEVLLERGAKSATINSKVLPTVESFPKIIFSILSGGFALTSLRSSGAVSMCL